MPLLNFGKHMKNVHKILFILNFKTFSFILYYITCQDDSFFLLYIFVLNSFDIPGRSFRSFEAVFRSKSVIKIVK